MGQLDLTLRLRCVVVTSRYFSAAFLNSAIFSVELTRRRFRCLAAFRNASLLALALLNQMQEIRGYI